MQKNNIKRLKKIAIWTASIFSVLMVVLVVHIYLVTRPKAPLPSEQIFLSRIDFEKSVDSLEAIRIMNHVQAMKGITSAHFNHEAGLFAYGYQKGLQTPEAVHEEVTKFTTLKSKRHIVSEEDLAKGCPAFDKSSFTYKFGEFVKNVFH
ncbi:hypothetical protein V9L05_11800 [Bernardetia sp. Wsw4-3y2]|uniref:hypothetical protein n=1 Tax=unclassified Bernardetia TaxID=2647129 RepID=UPI0030D1C117